MIKTSFVSTLLGKTTIALAIAGAVLATAPAAQARDGGLFDLLFGSSETTTRQRVIVNSPADFSNDIVISPRDTVRKPRRKVASAPVAKVEPAAEVSAFSDPGEQILHDPSLRRGDVVVFATGPKVFVGKASRQAPWSMEDFEDIATSKALSSKARVEVAAVTSNNGASQALVIEASIAPTPLRLASVETAPVN